MAPSEHRNDTLRNDSKVCENMALLGQWLRQRPWIGLGLGSGLGLLGLPGWFMQGSMVDVDGGIDHPLRVAVVRTLTHHPGLCYRELQTELNAPRYPPPPSGCPATSQGHPYRPREWAHLLFPRRGSSRSSWVPSSTATSDRALEGPTCDPHRIADGRSRRIPSGAGTPNRSESGDGSQCGECPSQAWHPTA